MLEEILAALSGKPGRAIPLAAAAIADVNRSRWTRLQLAPGLELHVSGARRLPPPGKLQELAEWCRRNFRGDEEGDDD